MAGDPATARTPEEAAMTAIGIERDAAYVRIVEARLGGTQRGLGLVDAPPSGAVR